MRHLASNGYRLAYEQDPRAEFVFGVTNLALDLRNGMRLCKLIELLCGEICRCCWFKTLRRKRQNQVAISSLLGRFLALDMGESEFSAHRL